MTIEFNCTACGKLLRTSDEKAGAKAKCPNCGGPIAVPYPDQPDAEAADAEIGYDDHTGQSAETSPGGTAPPVTGTMRACPVCGEVVSATAIRCDYCGERLPPGAPGAGQDDYPIPISAGDVISASWSIYQQRMGLCLGGFLVILVCVFAATFIAWIGALVLLPLMAGIAGPDVAVIGAFLGLGLFVLILIAFQTYMFTGQCIFFLKIARGEDAEIADLFSGGPYFVPMLVSSIIFGLLTTLGYTLCVVPGILVVLMLWPHQFLIVDRNLPGVEALSRAKEITEGNWGAVFLIMLASLGFYLLGYLACFVGTFFAVPLILLMFAVAYCRMTGQPTARPLP